MFRNVEDLHTSMSLNVYNMELIVGYQRCIVNWSQLVVAVSRFNYNLLFYFAQFMSNSMWSMWCRYTGRPASVNTTNMASLINHMIILELISYAQNLIYTCIYFMYETSEGLI